MLGGGVTNGSGSNLSNGGSAPDIVIGSNAASYEVDRSQSVDFARQTGTSADASSGLGYVTVTPLPRRHPFYRNTVRAGRYVDNVQHNRHHQRHKLPREL